MECQGPSGAVIPETLLWSRFPLLRVAFQRREAIYIPDSSKIARGNFLGGRRKSGVLIVPLILEQPVGVLLLAHAQEQPPDSHSHGILLSLVHALEALLENAALYSRLSVSETRYRSIVSAAPFLIALVSARGDVLELNPQLLRELKRQGLRTRELLGANVLVDGVLPAEMRGLLTECLKTGRAVSREKIALNLPRGQELLRVHAVPLRGAGYPAAELLLIGEIITRYQSLIDEAERTERLAAIGRVAASLAHEINNPLQALRSHLELIRSYPLSEEEREQSFLILEREVERLDETTRRMLGFARPTSEVLQPVSIRGLLDQTLALSRNYLHHQQVEIVTEFREPLPPVMAAAGQLIQVFLNIVLNAAHAMQGKGRLEVRVRPVGERAEITFTNNGPPIPHRRPFAYFRALFHHPFRGHRTRPEHFTCDFTPASRHHPRRQPSAAQGGDVHHHAAVHAGTTTHRMTPWTNPLPPPCFPTPAFSLWTTTPMCCWRSAARCG